MALHERSVGATDEWYTPAYVFEAMAHRFDSDPTPGPHWAPATLWCRRQGVWEGCVWLNPPFGGRNGITLWLERFFAHGSGVALVPDRTSAPWWQTFAPRADVCLFVAPKIRFIGADGRPGTSPAQGTCLLGVGERGATAVRTAEQNRLGVCVGR